MAKVSAVVLCDFAQVREGLLFIASGGVTRRFAPKVPTTFSMMLALTVEIGPEELNQAHEMAVVIKHNETAQDAARVTGAFQQTDGDTFPGEGLYIPIVLDFRTLVVNNFGAYDVHTEVDGNVGPHLTCYIVEAPALP